MGSGFTLSGGDRVIAIYAERLQKRGHDVFVISRPKLKPSLSQKVRSWFKGEDWSSRAEKQPSHFDRLDVPHAVVESFRPIVDGDVPDADVAIATWWETAAWVANLSPSKGAKAYFIQHHEVFEGLPKDQVQASYRLPLYKITISKWLIELMASQYGDPDCSLVLNSVDTDQFHAPPRSKQALPTVGLLYSDVKWKGCDVSLKAFSLAAEKLPGLRLVAFGACPPSENFPLPPETDYTQVPAQATIKDIYARCDVWLCGSWGEGFHLPPLEAMACRCPVVSTEVGGPIDTIQNGVNGYVVPLGDSAALAEQLVRVLSLPEAQWKAMSDAAYATATQYTWDDATERFEAALEKAISRQNLVEHLPQ